MSLAQAIASDFDPSTVPAQPAKPPEELPTPTPRPPFYPSGVTEREVEVLRRLAQGLTYEQIAEQLVISPRTVNRHLSSIYAKLVVTSRHAATRWAIDHHLA